MKMSNMKMNKKRKLGIILWMVLGGVSSSLFLRQPPTTQNSTTQAKAEAQRGVASDSTSAPSKTEKGEKSFSLPYAKKLKISLLRGMPKGTRVAISYQSSFTVNEGKGKVRRDILTVETTLPNGRKYAYKASYDLDAEKIIRTWGGSGHHGPEDSGFTLQ